MHSPENNFSASAQATTPHNEFQNYAFNVITIFVVPQKQQLTLQ